MELLVENGFAVRYIHPNTLFICWKDWVPTYVRNELKKKTGLSVNEFGKKIENTETEKQADVNQMFLQPAVANALAPAASTVAKKNYTSVKSYKPSGKLIYNDDLLGSLDDKLP